jgi:hypothetical protein
MLRTEQNEMLNRAELATLAQYGAHVGYLHSNIWTRTHHSPECSAGNVRNDLMIQLFRVMSYLRS